MSDFWNSRVKKLSPYTPGEQPKDRQIIKLNTNENPYPPSPKVIEPSKMPPEIACACIPILNVRHSAKPPPPVTA